MGDVGGLDEATSEERALAAEKALMRLQTQAWDEVGSDIARVLQVLNEVRDPARPPVTLDDLRAALPELVGPLFGGPFDLDVHPGTSEWRQQVLRLQTALGRA
jgi:hypothetical protein